MSFEVVEYKYASLGAIFRRGAPPEEDFKVGWTGKFRTKKEAMACVKGLNLVVETVDAPYMPIKVYRVTKGERKLVWSQNWEYP